jgi:formylmethanofuran dehydrogenase subunit E
MALLAAEILGIELPRTDKRLLVFAETDGCTMDGIMAATGCHVGGRTLRILDYRKVAATFTDAYTETSIRIHPSPQSRALAFEYAPQARNRWEAMLLATELFIVQNVHLIHRYQALLTMSTEKRFARFARKKSSMGAKYR